MPTLNIQTHTHQIDRYAWSQLSSLWFKLNKGYCDLYRWNNKISFVFCCPLIFMQNSLYFASKNKSFRSIHFLENSIKCPTLQISTLYFNQNAYINKYRVIAIVIIKYTDLKMKNENKNKWTLKNEHWNECFLLFLSFQTEIFAPLEFTTLQVVKWMNL